MKFSFFSLLKFGFGFLAWKRKYPEAVNDLVALLATLAPTPTGVTPSEAIEKVQTGNMTPTEKTQFDRASNPNAGGV